MAEETPKSPVAAASPEPKKSSLTYSAEFSPTISRLFIFRGFAAIPAFIVLYIWMIWIGIVEFLHFWIMLFAGKRNQWFWGQKLKLMRFLGLWQAYVMTLVDERPGYWPE